jgi:hypothetical protein
MNEQATPELSTTFECPECGHELSVKAILCFNCQTTVEGYWHSHGKVAMFYRIRNGVDCPEPDFAMEIPIPAEPAPAEAPSDIESPESSED